MWCFDPSRHLLTDGHAERRLEPKAVAVLARLAESPGEVVAKGELLAAGWEDRYVGEEVLTNAIYQLRRALDDDAREPRWIETIPKRGYRLIAPLRGPESPAAGEDPEGRERRRRVVAAWAALAAVAVLAVGLVAGAPRQRTSQGSAVAPGATGLVQRGWRALESARDEGAEEAAVLAREALVAEPESPEAWALLSAAGSARAARGAPGERDRAWAAAAAAAERALVLAPGHPRALAARARARWLGSWDWSGAEADLAQALAANPRSASLWTDRAELLFFSGRLDEARRAADRALEIDPGSARARITAGLVAAFAGDADAAVGHYRAVLRRHPGHSTARRQLAKLDRPPERRSTAERLEGLTRKGRVRSAHVALWFLESGDAATALDWLERAVDERDPTVLFFRWDSRWDGLRDHPRYRAAMARTGLAPSS